MATSNSPNKTVKAPSESFNFALSIVDNVNIAAANIPTAPANFNNIFAFKLFCHVSNAPLTVPRISDILSAISPNFSRILSKLSISSVKPLIHLRIDNSMLENIVPLIVFIIVVASPVSNAFVMALNNLSTNDSPILIIPFNPLPITSPKARIISAKVFDALIEVVSLFVKSVILAVTSKTPPNKPENTFSKYPAVLANNSTILTPNDITENNVLNILFKFSLVSSLIINLSVNSLNPRVKLNNSSAVFGGNTSLKA